MNVLKNGLPKTRTNEWKKQKNPQIKNLKQKALRQPADQLFTIVAQIFLKQKK